MSEEFVQETLEREQTQEATDKKCPACGGTVEFDPSSGGLYCPYCGSKYEIEATKDENEQTAAKEKNSQKISFKLISAHPNYKV